MISQSPQSQYLKGALVTAGLLFVGACSLGIVTSFESYAVSGGLQWVGLSVVSGVFALFGVSTLTGLLTGSSLHTRITGDRDDIPEQTVTQEGNPRQTAVSVLRAAQKDLQKVFIVFLIGFIGSFYALRLYVWEFLRGITAANMPPAIEEELSIIAQTPFEVILLQGKIGLVVGAIVGLPALVYFGRDALRRRGLLPQSPMAPWKVALVGVSAVVLLSAGVAYGYFVFFPVMFNFLASFGLGAGLTPSYSIVMWTEFIVFLSLSFGLAGQMPLLVTGLAYSEVVQYETFRDKWRYAVLAIVVFGAMFSPPDPFTQLMWAFPLILLYGFSLYLAKIVVTAKRESRQINIRGAMRARWNTVVGAAASGAAVVYGFYEYGGRGVINSALTELGANVRLPPPEEGLIDGALATVATHAVFVAVVSGGLAVLYVVYTELDTESPPGPGDTEEVDISELSVEKINSVSQQRFEELAEEDALMAAEQAVTDGEPVRARAILDRFDDANGMSDGDEDAQSTDQVASETEDTESGNTGTSRRKDTRNETISDRASNAGSTLITELTENTDEEDIGGYYTDIKFVFESIRSRSFRIVLWFLAVMTGTFTWMYLGGIEDIKSDFTSLLPASVRPEDFTVITLHPVEALVFMVKFSVLAGMLAILPMLVYYGWPAFRDRGWVRGHRRQVLAWTGALTAGLVGGFALGYAVIAPEVISYLVADALQSGLLVTYQINDFLWLIIFMTGGIGVLLDIPVLMVLLNSAGVQYDVLRGRWREVTFLLLSVAALLPPDDVITMFLITIPLLSAYGGGLCVLFVVTLGGRRDLAPPGEVISVSTSVFDTED